MYIHAAVGCYCIEEGKCDSSQPESMVIRLVGGYISLCPEKDVAKPCVPHPHNPSTVLPIMTQQPNPLY